jgi:hypothetical protein
MDPCEQLRNKLKQAVERSRADGILLSGGLDTSILAFKGSLASALVYPERIARLCSYLVMRVPVLLSSAARAVSGRVMITSRSRCSSRPAPSRNIVAARIFGSILPLPNWPSSSSLFDSATVRLLKAF